MGVNLKELSSLGYDAKIKFENHLSRNWAQKKYPAKNVLIDVTIEKIYFIRS